jgi:hypothetical protein
VARSEVELEREALAEGLDFDVGVVFGLEREETHVAAFPVGQELDVVPREMRIEKGLTGRDDDRTTRGKRRYDLGLSGRDRLDGPEELEMRGSDLRDDSHIRSGDRAEFRHLAGAPGAHLADHQFGLRGRPRECQRKPDLVVQALLGGDRA